MDPLTALGAVASIVQLAQGALSLSKTLYSLGAAVASANDDIQVLADDLKTFSQSLTLLSRLLEDSKAWYSDDIYLLTAKIIKDCAELYVKIDKILVKLGGNGKSTWKLRVKFVYKEGQIRKLMKRLRDMKGTLATILMSLQVDLQLSLLNISSSSKIQREPEKPLQPDTIQTLLDAQKAAQETGFVTTRTVCSDHIIQVSEKGFDVLSTQYQEANRTPAARNPTASMNWTQSLLPENEPSVISRGLNHPDSTGARDFNAGFANVTGIPAMHPFQPINMMVHHQISHTSAVPKVLDPDFEMTKSLKSASSVESFQSAVSVQPSLLEPESQNGVQQQVDAVRGVLHAFRTALEVLGKLMEKRLLVKKQNLYPTAKYLEKSLTDGENELKGTHDRHCKLHGPQYVQAFTDSHNTVLHDVTSTLMKDVVMPLHTYSADHVIIRTNDFDTLRACSERCQVQAVLVVVDVASLFGTPHPEINLDTHSSVFEAEIVSTPPERTIQYIISKPPPHHTVEWEGSLPFIGYTFKRFDNNFRGTQTQQSPIQQSTSMSQAPSNNISPVSTQSHPLMQVPQGYKSPQSCDGYNLPAMSRPILSNVHNPGNQMALVGGMSMQVPWQPAQRETIVKPEKKGLDALRGEQPDLSNPSVKSPLSRSDAECNITATTAATSMSPFLGYQFRDEGNPLISGFEKYSLSPAYPTSSPAFSPANGPFQNHDSDVPSPIPGDQRIQEQGGRESQLNDETTMYAYDMMDNDLGSSEGKKRRGRAALRPQCQSCNRSETPEWRPGPDGARTLCNACGLHYAKLTRKETMERSVPAMLPPALQAPPTQEQMQRLENLRLARLRQQMQSQQQQGVMAQEAGQMVVPASGAPRNGLLAQLAEQQRVMAAQHQASVRASAQVKGQQLALQAQQLAPQGQSSGMGNGPMPPPHFPAMGTLNTPLRPPTQSSGRPLVHPDPRLSDYARNAQPTTMQPVFPPPSYSSPTVHNMGQRPVINSASSMSRSPPRPGSVQQAGIPAAFAHLAQPMGSLSWQNPAQSAIPPPTIGHGPSNLFGGIMATASPQSGTVPSLKSGRNQVPLVPTVSSRPFQSPSGEMDEPQAAAMAATAAASGQGYPYQLLDSSLPQNSPRMQGVGVKKEKGTPITPIHPERFRAKQSTRAESLQEYSPDDFQFGDFGEPRAWASDEGRPLTASVSPARMPPFQYVPLDQNIDKPMNDLEIPRRRPRRAAAPVAGSVQEMSSSSGREPNSGHSLTPEQDYRQPNMYAAQVRPHPAPAYVPPQQQMYGEMEEIYGYPPIRETQATFSSSSDQHSSPALIRGETKLMHSGTAALTTSRYPTMTVPQPTDVSFATQGSDFEYGELCVMDNSQAGSESFMDSSTPSNWLSGNEPDDDKTTRIDRLSNEAKMPASDSNSRKGQTKILDKKRRLEQLERRATSASQPMSISNNRSPVSPVALQVIPRLELQAVSSGHSMAPGLSATSSAIGAPHSIHGHIISLTDNRDDFKFIMQAMSTPHRGLPPPAVMTMSQPTYPETSPHRIQPEDNSWKKVGAKLSWEKGAGLAQEPTVDEHPQFYVKSELYRDLKRRGKRRGSELQLGETSKKRKVGRERGRETADEIVFPKGICSDDPFMKLWSQSYCSVKSSNPEVFRPLSSEIEERFGEFPSDISDEKLSTSVRKLVEGISAKTYNGRTALSLIHLIGYRERIVQVMMTISLQLGLQRPVIGWACFAVLLSKYDKFLDASNPDLTSPDVEAMTKSFQQLQDLVGLLARYAVMENLYHQSASLTLTPEYQNGLRDLCVAILLYFGHSFRVASKVGGKESTSVVESTERCDVLMDEIKARDKACQGFRVVVEADEQSDTDSEDEEVDDVSDGSWELLGNEGISVSEIVT